jgi:hypothetical protein
VSAQAVRKYRAPKQHEYTPVQKSDTEWKKILSPLAFEVMVNKGTGQAYRKRIS